MKNTINFLIAGLALILSACSGSDTYRGTWKAVDMSGQKFEITFDAKSLNIKDSANKAVLYEYTQNSVNIHNNSKTYGIKVSDGRGYQVHFPNNESEGLIRDESGNPVYTISRNAYVSYKDMFKMM
jgi:hypothetical protein